MTVLPDVPQIEVVPPPSSSFIPTIDLNLKPFTRYRASDAGRAQFMLDAFGYHLAFVPEAPKGRGWRIWDGATWQEDITGLLRHWIAYTLTERACSDVVRHIQSDQVEERKKALQSALKLSDAGEISSLLEIARTDPRVVVPIAKWDADPWRAGTLNGVLELRSGKHRKANRDDFIIKHLGAMFDGHADAPTWRRFLSDILPNNDLQAYVQEIIGYALTGSTAVHAFWFLHGGGANGKSVLVDVVQNLLGTYSARAGERLFADSGRGDPPEKELAALPGVRLLASSEVTEGMNLRCGVLKDLTGGDEVAARAVYGMPFSFRPTAKILIIGNHKPVIREGDGGIWRRVKLIPFSVTIPEEGRDPHLAEKLKTELPGILNWALVGLKHWLARGRLEDPALVRAAGADYRTDMDALADFIEEHIQEALPEYLEPKIDVFRRYQSWADDEGIRRQFSQKQFTRRLGERGYVLNGRRTHWMGISLIKH